MSQGYGSVHGGRDRAFVARLQRLVTEDDRGALAMLRRGLRRAPGNEPAMHKYVVPWLGDEKGWREDVFYLVASMFAFHPTNWPEDTEDKDPNLGASFARLSRSDGGSVEAVERRFTVLLSTHQEDLHVQLRHAVSLLKSKDVPVDWVRLLSDLRWWGNDDRSVQRRWAKAFWGQTP